MNGEEISKDQLELEDLMKEQAVKNVAGALHYLVVHADIKQYYYEVKYVRNDERLMDIIGRGLRELDMLKKSEEHKEKIKQLMLPSSDDLMRVLEFYRKFGGRFITALAAMSIAMCKLCFSKTQ
ncbi:MAG: hypothetical protein QXR97_03045 [Thermoproteota archaeon]